MKSTHQRSQQFDARQLILDADFDALAISEPRMIQVAHQWAVQVSSWLGANEDMERRTA